MTGKSRAPNNRTLVLTDAEYQQYQQQLCQLPLDDHQKGRSQALLNQSTSSNRPTLEPPFLNTTIHQDLISALPFFPKHCVDLLVVDPPYNRTKTFNKKVFYQRSLDEYQIWLDNWLSKIIRVLKPTASVYICCDWQSSNAIYTVMDQYLTIRNRITWEREKGRGAQHNWKNSSEDIWFATVSDDYFFNVEAVKLKRRVMAPYRDRNGQPKDWQDTEAGKFRITHPSNLWTDISIPFWSMPENTEHPTQKPEKLIAKLILSSSREGDVVFDPFLGSGTTSVVAKKLKRHYIGIEKEEYYCCLAEKRLALADQNTDIQGYAGGYFWERNTLAAQKRLNLEQLE